MAQKTKINVPTMLTLGRIVLVAPLMICLFMDDAVASKIVAFVIFVIAALTDLIDGKMARKNNQVTNLGAFLDPLADKMLVNLTILALICAGVLHPWFLAVILIRDFAVDGMRMMVAKTGETVSASIFGKAKTMVQMIFLGMAILEFPVMKILSENIGLGAYLNACDVVLNLNIIFEVIILGLTLFSGFDYLKKGWKKAIN